MKSRWMLVAGAVVMTAAPAVFAQVPQSATELALRGSSVVDTHDDLEGRDMVRRQELIPQILSAREAASGRRMSADLRGSLVGRLMLVPVASLEAFAAAGGLGNIDTLGPRVLGDSAADLAFTAVTPCRIINTVATSTPLAANTSRPFYVNGNAAGVFEAQGGNAGGCGIPDSATAVAMNFIAVAPAAPGDFRAFPWNATPTVPLASVINYANVPGLNIANGVTQPVCNAATTTCTFDLIVQADAGQSHLIIDVVGYYNKVDKAPVKSVTVFDVGSQQAVGTTCGNFGGLSATITAPVAGKIVASANATMFLTINGGNAEVDFFWGATATACTTGTTFVFLPGALPAGSYFLPVTSGQTFNVAAGSTTSIFFNSRGSYGGTSTGSTSSAGTTLQATFIPD
jgi:hypothetical protein